MDGMSFEQVVLGGLAHDRGLFVPEIIPSFSMEEIERVSLTRYLLSITLRQFSCESVQTLFFVMIIIIVHMGCFK